MSRSLRFALHGNPLITWMAIGSALAALLCMDPLLAVCGLAATCLVGLLWREDSSIVLLLCLAYQWLFAVAGVAYRAICGWYPSDHASAEIDNAVLLLLASLMMVAIGLWAALKIWERLPAWQSRRAWLAERSTYAPDRLFLCVLLLYAGSWMTTTTPKHVAYSLSQILYRLVEFRTVFLFLLFVAVLRWRRGWLLALVASAVVTLPLVTTGGSGFASVLIILVAAALMEGKALFVRGLRTPGNRRMFALLCVVGFALVNLGIMWQGAIKSKWRPIARSDQLDVSRVDRIGMFFEVAGTSVGDLDWNKGLESLAQRFSDVPAMMALVLERVPSEVAHENGGLTSRAIRHIARPRFLFPDKESLGSDSWLVRRYAGLDVAGEAQDTSIGLGYLIEFYVDYGTFGMMVAAFVFGTLVGSLHRMLLFAAPSMDLYRAATAAILLQHFRSLDGSLAKITGGLLMAYAVFGALLLLVGASLHRVLLVPPAGRAGPRVLPALEPVLQASEDSAECNR